MMGRQRRIPLPGRLWIDAGADTGTDTPEATAEAAAVTWHPSWSRNVMDRRFRLAVPNASGTTRRFSLAVGTSCTGVADPGTIRQGAHQGSWVVADSSRSTAMVHAKIRRYRRPMDHGRSPAARTDRVKQSPQAWPETSDSADVSEFRLRKLMQSSASPFVISSAVRDTWLSTGIHPLGGPDRRLFVRRLLADHCAEGAQIINSAPIQAARRTSWMTIGCPAVVSQLGMACSTSGSSIIARARPGWPGPDSTRIGIRITAGSAAGKSGEASWVAGHGRERLPGQRCGRGGM